jgi:hypothetical protein
MISWCLTRTAWYNKVINTQSQSHTIATSAEKQQMLLGTSFMKINLSTYKLKASGVSYIYQ